MKPFNSKRIYWFHAIVTVLLALATVGLTSSPAQAGPGCEWYGCGSVANRSSVGIGVLINARSTYGYDFVLPPGAASSSWVPDMDKVYAGAGWCVEGYSVNGWGSFFLRGPGNSVNIDDRFGRYNLYAYRCTGQFASW